MGRHLLTQLAVSRTAVAACVAVLVALALPAGASAALDDSGDWVPGSALIKFNTQKTHRIESFLQGVDASLVRPLPLIPGGYEIEVNGKLPDAITKAITQSHEKGAVKIEWAQPNYYLHLKYFSAPTEKDYWPNDP